MRNGVEIWVEAIDARKLQDILSNIKQSTFLHFGTETINSADVVGVFSAGTMADNTQRKNGRWKCDQGNWHDRNEKCDCAGRDVVELNKRKAEAIAKCGKCNNGWVIDGIGMKKCSCVAGL